MIKTPPRSSVKGHVECSWPIGILGQYGRPTGYYMPVISDAKAIHNLYNPKGRKKHFSGFDLRHIHRVALNLCSAISSIHDRGYIVGDLNESNILVNHHSLVSVIDTDSFQFTSNGKTFPCRVAKPELMAPEIQGINPADAVRTKEQDLFSLGVIIFQLLMNGSHPFRGTTGPAEPGKRIEQGLFPFSKKGRGGAPPIHYEDMEPKIRHLFERCFIDGHRNPSTRPSAMNWVQALALAEKDLRTCDKDNTHIFVGNSCPHCQRARISKQIAKPPPSAVPKTTAGRNATTPSPQPAYAATPRSSVKRPYNILHDFGWMLVAWVTLSLITSGVDLLQEWFYLQSIPYLFWGLSGSILVGIVGSLDRNNREMGCGLAFFWLLAFYLIRFGYFLFSKIFDTSNLFFLHSCYILGSVVVCLSLWLIWWIAKRKLWLTVFSTGSYLLVFSLVIFFGGDNFNPMAELVQERTSTAPADSGSENPKKKNVHKPQQGGFGNITSKEKTTNIPGNSLDESKSVKLRTDDINDGIMPMLSQPPFEDKPNGSVSASSRHTQDSPRSYRRSNSRNHSQQNEPNVEHQLMEVLANGNLETAKVYIRRMNIDLTVSDQSGDSALSYVVKYGDLALLQNLAATSGYLNPDQQNYEGETILMTAIRQGSVDKVQLILQKFRPDLSIRNQSRETALQVAKSSRDQFKRTQIRKRRPYKRILKLLKKYDSGNLGGGAKSKKNRR